MENYFHIILDDGKSESNALALDKGFLLHPNMVGGGKVNEKNSPHLIPLIRSLYPIPKGWTIMLSLPFQNPSSHTHWHPYIQDRTHSNCSSAQWSIFDTTRLCLIDISLICDSLLLLLLLLYHQDNQTIELIIKIEQNLLKNRWFETNSSLKINLSILTI